MRPRLESDSPRTRALHFRRQWRSSRSRSFGHPAILRGQDRAFDVGAAVGGPRRSLAFVRGISAGVRKRRRCHSLPLNRRVVPDWARPWALGLQPCRRRRTSPNSPIGRSEVFNRPGLNFQLAGREQGGRHGENRRFTQAPSAAGCRGAAFSQRGDSLRWHGLREFSQGPLGCPDRATLEPVSSGSWRPFVSGRGGGE